MADRKYIGQQDTAEYMTLRCAACGMLHVIHRKTQADGLSCRDCGGGPLVPMGYAIMLDRKPTDITVKVEVDTSDLDKVQRLVDEIDESVSSMIKRLIGVKGELMQHDGTNL